MTVERIEGRSVGGLRVGDYFELTESSRIRIPERRHFCIYALQAVLPLLPAKQRRLPDDDWLEQESLNPVEMAPAQPGVSPQVGRPASSGSM